MSALARWMCLGTLAAAGAFSFAVDQAVLPTRTVNGNLDERARLEAVHAEMQRECGASPAGGRCQRLKREFQQEARNYRKRRRK